MDAPKVSELDTAFGPFELDAPDNRRHPRFQERIRLHRESERIRREEVAPLQVALQQSETQRRELESQIARLQIISKEKCDSLSPNEVGVVESPCSGGSRDGNE